MSKHLEAVKALIEHEIMPDCDFIVEISDADDSKFGVSFNRNDFNSLIIRVDKIDEENRLFSQFSVHVYEDYWEDFCCFDFTVKELWKALLWK